MLKITLAVEDRERLGAPEVLEFDHRRVMAREAALLQKVTGLQLRDIAKGLRANDPEAWLAVVWLALRRAGVTVTYSELDFDIHGLDLDGDGVVRLDADGNPIAQPEQAGAGEDGEGNS